MIASAPVFWIFIGLLELWALFSEGWHYWFDSMFGEDDEEEVAKEK